MEEFEITIEKKRCDYKTCRKNATHITKKRLSGYLFTTQTCDEHAEIIYLINFEDPPIHAPTTTNTITYDGRMIDGT